MCEAHRIVSTRRESFSYLVLYTLYTSHQHTHYRYKDAKQVANIKAFLDPTPFLSIDAPKEGEWLGKLNNYKLLFYLN